MVKFTFPPSYGSQSSIDLSRILGLKQPGKTDQRNACPNALMQEKAPLSGLCRLDCQHGGAHEIASEVCPSHGLEATQLDENERNSDQQGTSYLDQLPHIDLNGF